MGTVKLQKDDVAYGISLIIVRKRELRNILRNLKPSNDKQCKEYLELSKEEKILDWVLEYAFVLDEFNYLKNEINIEIV